MSSYDLYRNTICKYDDNDYIILFKNDEISEEISEKEKFIEFCGIFGFKVSDTQMKVFELYNQSKQENKQMFINLGRQQGQNYLNTILINFELWEKDQRIAELEKENEKLGKTLINAINLDIERKNRIAELEGELKKEQEKHCDTCCCDLQRENEKLKAELERKNQMLTGKRFEMFDNDIKQTSTLNGVEFTYEQMLVIKQYEGFCDNKEKQTAVKEFADGLIQDYNNNGFNDSYWYIDRVDSLLKEKGIE